MLLRHLCKHLCRLLCGILAGTAVRNSDNHTRAAMNAAHYVNYIHTLTACLLQTAETYM